MELRILRARFPGWEITNWETSVGVLMWSAFWKSEDGHRRVFRVTGSADELGYKLNDYAWHGVHSRAAGAAAESPPGNEAGHLGPGGPSSS